MKISPRKHKAHIYSLYQQPSFSKSYVRAARTEKFSPIFNQKLKKGIVVDLGCGVGTYTKLVLSKKIVGVDFSLESLKAAKRNCPPRCIFLRGDMEHLPFKKEAIDSFFSFCAVYCLLPESQNKLFKELYLMLRKNGNILLVEPNKLNPFKEREPKHPLRKSKVERWLREIGFKNINIRYCDFISRPIVKRGGVIFDFFKLSEKFFEFLQIPFSGTLVIYAEK